MGGGVAETEGVRARREEELAMAPVPPEGCRECVREGGEVDGDIDGGDDDGVDRPATDPLLLASVPSIAADLPGVPCPPPSLLTMMDKLEEVVFQLMELVDDRMKDRRRT